MALKFQKVTTGDEIETLAELAAGIWREYFVRLISRAQIEYMLDRFLSPAALTLAIREDGYDYRLARERGETVGFYGAQQRGEELFLSKLYFKESARGRGLASELFAFLRALCAARGVKRMRLTCNKRNAETLAVYRHWGFCVEESVVTDIGGGYVMDDYVMKLELA